MFLLLAEMATAKPFKPDPGNTGGGNQISKKLFLYSLRNRREECML